MGALTTPSQRHPQPAITEEAEKQKPARKTALRSPRKESPNRSRSPLPRKVQVQFDPKEKEIPAELGDSNPNLMRMKDAREAVPRKEGESRNDWKNRIFQHKRKFEEKMAQSSKGKTKEARK